MVDIPDKRIRGVSKTDFQESKEQASPSLRQKNRDYGILSWIGGREPSCQRFSEKAQDTVETPQEVLIISTAECAVPVGKLRQEGSSAETLRA